MKQSCLFYALIFLNVSSCNQNKDTIDVCSLMNAIPSVMAYDIPDKKCTPNNENLSQIKKDINSRFAVNGNLIDANLFLIDKYSFIEMVYQNQLCDTVAILFLVDEHRKIINTKPYKINTLDKDVRMQISKDEIILYRKIKIKQEEATISFQFDKVQYRIVSFIDDGASIWQSEMFK